MQRYFIKETVTDRLVPIQIMKEDYHHMIRVMRMRIKDLVWIVDASQQLYKAEITDIDSKQEIVFLTLIEQISQSVELPITVGIAFGLSKGEKVDWITQKATELGAHHFYPIAMERNIVKWDASKGEKKRQRYEKIAKEAAEQSHRLVVPSFSSVLTIKELIEVFSTYSKVLIAYEEEAKEGTLHTLKAELNTMKPGDSLLFVFGPEGGISESEIDLLTKAKAKCCALGPRILRAETAPMYALTAISYQLEV